MATEILNTIIIILHYLIERLLTVHALLIATSGACFLCGTILLALSIEFQAEKIVKDNSRLQRATKRMGSPGLRNLKKHKAGMILSCIGYVLLLLSMIF